MRQAMLRALQHWIIKFLGWLQDRNSTEVPEVTGENTATVPVTLWLQHLNPRPSIVKGWSGSAMFDHPGLIGPWSELPWIDGLTGWSNMEDPAHTFRMPACWKPENSYRTLERQHIPARLCWQQVSEVVHLSPRHRQLGWLAEAIHCIQHWARWSVIKSDHGTTGRPEIIYLKMPQITSVFW